MTDYTSLNYEHLFNAYNQQAVVKAVVGDVSGNGHQVYVLGFPAFLPSTQEAPGESFIPGREIEVCIIKIMPDTNNVVVSAIVAAEILSREEAEKLEIGKIVTATITNLTDYGAFASIGRTSGLIHITELSYKKFSHPSEIVSVGMEIPVKILTISETDERGRRKIGLSYKQALPNPWESLSINVGDIVEGVVERITDYGIFFLLDNISAMVHRSELSWNSRTPNPKEFTNVGDTIRAKIISIDKSKKIISASIRHLSEDPWQTLGIEQGDVIEASISNKTNSVIFIKVAEGIEGVLHKRDLAWDKYKSNLLMDSLSIGDTVRVVLLDINKEKHRLSFSMKHLETEI